LFVSLFLPKNRTVSIVWWIALVLTRDVSHVYTTFYRPHFDKNIIINYSILLKATPLLCLAIGVE